jgi:hypothetical protein
MTHPSDDPPSAPPVESVENDASSATQPSAPGENASQEAGSQNPTQHTGEPRQPRRRRRRRRPSPMLAPEAIGQAQSEQTALSGNTTAPENSPRTPPAEGEPPKTLRRRRRRRRGPPREAASQEGTEGGDAQAEAGASVAHAAQSSPSSAERSERPENLASNDNAPREHPRRRRRPRRPAHGGNPTEIGSESRSGSELIADAAARSEAAIGRPRVGGPRNRRPRDGSPQRAGPRDREPQDAGSREWRPRNIGQRRAGGRQSDRQADGARTRGPRGTGSGDRRQGRDRDARPKKPEPKLYALESVVDRGFEDVTEESDESATRRVHWTIVKRTVADQKSGKAMSAVYVLQREGVDSEYPNLGAARAAVNKTIVHPEKLTLSKAEHAAAKK